MAWLVAAAVTAADILMKRYAAAVWSKTPCVLIDGVLELVYVENRGAAWGMLQGARVAFIILTVIFLVLVTGLYVKKRAELNTLSRLILALLFAGALGNLIDRVIYGYVRDMIYFSLIQFPVFNVADSSIVIGAGLLIVQTLFCKNGLFEVIERLRLKKRNSDTDEH